MEKYDYLIVGSGLFGSVFAYKAMQAGKSCLVIDKRRHIGGNLFCEEIEGINVHTYGPHIFHTSDREVWNFVNHFVHFNRYINTPLANYKGELYNLPFNMNTFHQLWGVKTPEEAKQKLAEQQGAYADIVPRNLEEQALKLVGKDIYERLIKGYTQKQWGYHPKDLPSFIIRRLPVRFTFDNNYFNDTFQGIPMGGYNTLILRMLKGITVLLNTDFFKERRELQQKAKTVVYSGMLDAYEETGDVAFRDGSAQHGELPRQCRGELHGCRSAVHPHHRAQAFRIRQPSENGDYKGIPAGLGRKERGLLPGEQRGKRCLGREVPPVGQAGTQRDIRRSAGRLQVLRHG